MGRAKKGQAKTVIRLVNVDKIYELGDSKVKVLSDINLTINEGEYVAIVGPSGSGKSTLMHIMGLLDQQTNGQVYLNSKDVSGASEAESARLRNSYLGFIFQQFNLLKRTSALDNVLLPTLYGESQNSKVARAKTILTELGLGDKFSNHANQLSGGQQQRVAIARALINDPSVIFADEPTGNLDSRSGHEVIKILSDLNAKGKTIILVTHDMDIAKESHRLIKILDGKIVSDKRIKK